MGTTLDKPLYYVNLTYILACAGLRFTLILHNPYGARQVFGAVAREKFCVDIDNSVIDITLDFFSLFTWLFCYTSACNFVSVFLCVIAIKVIVCVCEDRVKLNYSRSILSQREP